MKKPMRRWNEIISISCSKCELVKTNGHTLHFRLGPIKTGTYHPTAGTPLLYITLAESCREGEFTIIEGIIKIEIERLLGNFSFMNINLIGSYFLATMKSL